MIDWRTIKTVLIDMDGTLLDLHFDNFFWLEHLPMRYAEKNNISFEKATEYIEVEMSKVSGQIESYCLDYWQIKLNLPIVELKREIKHKISLRPDTIPFLNALKMVGKEVVLVTNAHPNGLSLKVKETALDSHINRMISTHKYGVTKESQALWLKLQEELNFNSETTLFVDDSLVILDSAKTFGIKHLLAVANPDSQQPVVNKSDFKTLPYITDYRDIIADIC